MKPLLILFVAIACIAFSQDAGGSRHCRGPRLIKAVLVEQSISGIKTVFMHFDRRMLPAFPQMRPRQIVTAEYDGQGWCGERMAADGSKVVIVHLSPTCGRSGHENDPETLTYNDDIPVLFAARTGRAVAGFTAPLTVVEVE